MHKHVCERTLRTGTAAIQLGPLLWPDLFILKIKRLGLQMRNAEVPLGRTPGQPVEWLSVAWLRRVGQLLWCARSDTPTWTQTCTFVHTNNRNHKEPVSGRPA